MTVVTTSVPEDGGYDFGDVVLKGAMNNADLREALTDWPQLERAIDGGSTLTLTVDDHRRTLVDSSIFADVSFADVADLHFDFVNLKKSGDILTLTFEDSNVTAMKRQTSDLTIPGGTMTRGAVLGRLFAEAGVGYLIDPNSQVYNKAFERKDGANSWELSGTLAQEIGWRRYSDGRNIVAGSDEWLAGLNPVVELREFTGYCHGIDFELDVAMPANESTATLDSRGWVLQPGQPVNIVGQGMANGTWLVKSMARAEGITHHTVTLTRRQLVIPEPPPESSAVDSDAGEAGNLPTGAGGTILTPPAGKYGNTTLNAEQIGFAVRIARVAANHNLGNRGAVLGIMCALQESGLRNLPGGDRDSVGLFQQRASWGSFKQRTTPEWAAGAFYDALVKVRAWATATPAKVIQAVQKSAYPDAYAKHRDEAEALVQAMVSTANNPSTTNAAAGSSGRLAAIAQDLAPKVPKYVFGGKDVTKGCDCSGFVAECTKRNGKQLAGGSKAQKSTVEKAGRLISVQQALKTPGALLFRMTGDPTHVAISLGNGSTAEARGKGPGVGIFPNAAGRDWTHGGLWP